MNFWLLLLIAGALFVVGVKLSAFFSGSETGFYRVSFLRLSIDAHTGDTVARRLLWFVQHPEFFVATTLVGNNIANYVTTLAIGFGSEAFIKTPGIAMEISMTLLISPVIFIFGELMPKNLYFRAPDTLLRRNSSLFQFFYRALLPASTPMVWITRLFERLSGSQPHQLDLVLGRHRLGQVLNQGHEHGILTRGQGALIHGLLHDASLHAVDLMIPLDEIYGIEEGTPREEIIELASRHTLTHIPVRRRGTLGDWFGYVRVLDVEIADPRAPLEIRPMPEIQSDATRLTALLTIRESGEGVGVVTHDGQVQGILLERVLIDQFMHPASAPSRRSTADSLDRPVSDHPEMGS